MKFYGREKELETLKRYYDSDKFEFGIIHGRRRVGKTTLLRKSIEDRKSIYFYAQQANHKTNLDQFSRVFSSYKGYGNVSYDSYENLFTDLFREKNLIVIIDEFTYLCSSYPPIESLLQKIIDQYRDESSIKLIISGSEIGMFENLFAQNKPLYGRMTFQLKLKECDYLESSLYYPAYSCQDKIRTYAVFGGLPYYLAQIDDNKSLKSNICDLIVDETARLADELNMILTSELRNIAEYQSILQAIHSGGTKLSDISNKSHIGETGKTAIYTKKLTDLEIVEKERRFSDNMNSRNHIYRITNNFVAFFYNFIWNNLSSRVIMPPDEFYDEFIGPKLDIYVSMRFETICKQFLVKRSHKNTGKPIAEIGRYWYNDRSLKKDVEIDICTKVGSKAYAYECKWTNGLIDEDIMRNLIGKSQYIGATGYGAFSKSGFDENVMGKGYDLISIHDMFDL